MQNSDSISYLNQQQASEIDETLMGPLGFSLDQLMVSFLLPSESVYPEIFFLKLIWPFHFEFQFILAPNGLRAFH